MVLMIGRRRCTHCLRVKKCLEFSKDGIEPDRAMPALCRSCLKELSELKEMKS